MVESPLTYAGGNFLRLAHKGKMTCNQNYLDGILYHGFANFPEKGQIKKYFRVLWARWSLWILLLNSATVV